MLKETCDDGGQGKVRQGGNPIMLEMGLDLAHEIERPAGKRRTARIIALLREWKLPAMGCLRVTNATGQ